MALEIIVETTFNKTEIWSHENRAKIMLLFNLMPVS